MGPARDADGADDLLDWLPEIRDRGFVFVRDAQKRVCGIITTADLTDQLDNQLRPFLLVSEIERRLRRIVGRAVDDGRIGLDQVRNGLRPHRRNRVRDVEDLTLGEYPHVFKSEDLWTPLRWSLDRGQFLTQLHTAAQFRNNLMHLNPDLDPQSTQELEPLRGLLEMLRPLDDS